MSEYDDMNDDEVQETLSELRDANNRLASKLAEMTAQLDTLADAITNFQNQFDRIAWHWDGDCGAQDMADELFGVLAAVKGEKP